MLILFKSKIMFSEQVWGLVNSNAVGIATPRQNSFFCLSFLLDWFLR